MDNLIDIHCHSDNSFDSSSPVLEMVEAAKEKKLAAFCITDHCDLYAEGENKNAECFNGDMIEPIVRSVALMESCKKENTSGTILLSGVELGQPTHNESAAKRLLTSCDFDFVLASIHNLRAEKDFFFMEYDKLDVPTILKRYFCELVDVCEQNLFDSLAHLTYPLRYIIGNYNINVDLKDYKDIIDAILKTLIKNGKALEVNTSGLRQKINSTMPDFDIISRYRELGGEYITVGSDAHRPEDIGHSVKQTYDMLKNLGFSHVVYYKNHIPYTISI